MELLQSAEAVRPQPFLPRPRLIHYRMPIFILDYHEFQIIAFCTNGVLRYFIHDNAVSVWNTHMHYIQHQTTSQNGIHRTTELTVSAGLLLGKKMQQHCLTIIQYLLLKMRESYSGSWRSWEAWKACSTFLPHKSWNSWFSWNTPFSFHAWRS